MLPGPDRIIACPRCGHVAREICSTFAGVCSMRTDGAFVPTGPDATRCKGCGRCYFLDEAKRIGEGPLAWERVKRVAGQSDQEYAEAILRAQERREAERVAEPSEQEYLVEVQTAVQEASRWWTRIMPGRGRSLRDRVRRLRLAAWRRGNDEQRTVGDKPPQVNSMSADRSANMVELIASLDEEVDSDRLILAELRRHLGHFDEVRKLLARSFPRLPDHTLGEDLRHRARRILDLAEQGRTEISYVSRDEATTPEERAEQVRQQEEKKQREKEHQAARLEAFRQSILDPVYQAAKRAEQERIGKDVREGRRCPRCEFAFGWDGARCSHCQYPDPSS